MKSIITKKNSKLLFLVKKTLKIFGDIYYKKGIKKIHQFDLVINKYIKL